MDRGGDVMKIVTVKMPPALVELIDEYVKKGRFSSRSDFIREAIRFYILHLQQQEEEGIDKVYSSRDLEIVVRRIG